MSPFARSREVDAYEYRDSYDFTSHLWDVGDTKYYHETVNEEFVDAEDHLSASSETIDGSTTQQSDASGFRYLSPQYTYYTRTTYYYGCGSSGSGSGGGGGSASVEEQTTSSGQPYYDPSASEYEYLGDAGAYEDFPDLPADWSSLQSESSPYVFGGGWENHFTDPFAIQASVVTDQDAMQGLVEELDISRFYTFADVWTSMTPGVGLIHDGHQAITGENAVTGEELSGFESSSVMRQFSVFDEV